jgi:hypothetical protein
MGRSRSRRRRGKSGGVGSSRSKSKSNKSKSKSTGGSRGRSNNTRGGQSKANRNQNKKAKRTVKSVAKSIGKAFKGAAAHASGHTKKKSKLQQQFSNLRSNIQRQSTPEAKKQRRADRLRNQFGLDYSRMNPSFKVDASIDQAARRLGIHNNPLYKRLPKDVRNWKFKYQMRSPTKLGTRDKYRAPNRGVQNIASNTRDQLQSIRSATPGYKGQSLQGDMITGRGGTGSWLDFYRPENQKRLQDDRFQLRTHDFRDSNGDGIDDRDQYTTGQPGRRIDGPIPDNPIRSIRRHPGRRGPDQQGPGYGLFPIPRPIRGPDQQGPGWGIPGRPPRPITGLPSAKHRRQNTIEAMYENILGRKADQEGLDYWRNESRSGRQSMDSIRQNILRSDEFKGRSEADREAALRGVEQRRYERENPRFGRPHHRGGKPPRQKHGGGLLAKGLGLATRNWKRKGRAKPTGRKPTGRGLFPSIAASMAARGTLK